MATLGDMLKAAMAVKATLHDAHVTAWEDMLFAKQVANGDYEDDAVPL